ncbi:MAG: HIT family protein [Phycisphaerales bacterium]|nr:MAG: HIT family protein [Phycisphaerales bacterium]
MSDYQETIFDRIIAGEIPCHKVYEDEQVFAFLDIGPLSEGHTLVLPREKKAFLHELSEEAAAGLGRALPKLCRAVKEATGAEAYNVLVNSGESAGQVVMHVHLHIIPKFPDTGFKMGWNAGKLDDERAERLVGRIRSNITES